MVSILKKSVSKRAILKLSLTAFFAGSSGFVAQAVNKIENNKM
jgi:hypothetical protein